MENLKRFIIVYLFMFFTLMGCKNILVFKQKNSIKKATKIRKVVYVDVNMEGTDLIENTKVKDILMSKAERKAILEVARDWLNKRFMFQLSKEIRKVDNHIEPKNVKLNILDKDFKPSYDNMTNIYEAKFKFEAELDPVACFTGEVTGIEGGYSLATSHIAIELFGNNPIGDTFFVVAKKNDFNAGSYYQMIGIGKIYHVIGRIAQAEILTSIQEIRQNDLVILLKTKISPIRKKKTIKQQEKTTPVVKVYPIIEKKEQGPKEMK